MDIREVIKKGAVIVDVRTAGEYALGHVAGALNIPLDEVEEAAEWLQKDVPLVVCCASGARSAVAEDILKAHGFEVYNGGSCSKLDGLKSGAGCVVNH